MAPKPKAKPAAGKKTAIAAKPTEPAAPLIPDILPFSPPALASETTRAASRQAVLAAAGGQLATLAAALADFPGAVNDALMAAVLGGHAKTAQVALLSGADPASPLPGAPLAPIHVAASQGDVAVLRELLAAPILGGARAANACCSMGRTPLMYAAMNGQREAVSALLALESGGSAAVGHVDVCGLSAADYAKRCVEALL